MQWYYVHAVDQLVGLTAIEIAFNDDPKVGLSISHHPFHVRSNAWLCSAYIKSIDWKPEQIARRPRPKVSFAETCKSGVWKRGESLHRGRISTKVDWQMRAQIGRITFKAHISAQALSTNLGIGATFKWDWFGTKLRVYQSLTHLNHLFCTKGLWKKNCKEKSTWTF